MKCRSGGIGRRARFRFVWLTPCGFESHLRHFIFIYKLNRYGTKNPNAKHSGFERERAEGGGIDVCQFRRPVKRERPRQSHLRHLTFSLLKRKSKQKENNKGVSTSLQNNSIYPRRTLMRSILFPKWK